MPDSTIQYAASIAPGVLVSMEEHAARCAPDEACGILLGKRAGSHCRIAQIVATANVAEGDLRREYRVCPDELLRRLLDARRGGPSVLGFYHSHPDAAPIPSSRDKRDAWTDRLYFIVGRGDGTRVSVRCWCLPSGGESFIEVPVEACARVI